MSLYNDLTTVLTPYANKIKRNESDIGDIQDTLEHLDVETDTTLTQLGAPADAKAVGDEVADLKADLSDEYGAMIANVNGGGYSVTTWQNGAIYNWATTDNNTFQRSSVIHLNIGDNISFTGGKGTTALPINALTWINNGAYQPLKTYSGSTAETISYTENLKARDVIVSTLKTLYGDDLTVTVNGSLPKVNEAGLLAVNEKFDSLPNYVKQDINPLAIVSASAGSAAYKFVQGETYYVKNNGNYSINIATRVNFDGETIDTITVGANATVSFIASGDANYIVFPASSNLVLYSEYTLILFIDNTKAFIEQFDPQVYTFSSSGNIAYNFVKGNTYRITNKTLDTVRYATRNNPSGASIDYVDIQSNSFYDLKASGNAAYLIFSKACTFTVENVTEYGAVLEKNKFAVGFAGDYSPMVRFDFDYEMDDFTDELSGVDFADMTDGYYTIPDVVTAKFDSLVSSYSSYITKVDAGEDVDLSYPAYANLGGESSGDYSATPSYRTYLYKLIDDNARVYGDFNKKKKVLLIGATHGSESAGSFNLYLFAKKLCESTDPNYFKLRSAFDFYIVPCLNGYGMYHSLRWNANGVNINRNYPIVNWVENDEPYTNNYTGPSPASEFETQLIVALHGKYGFDIAIDHHNYGASNGQFYTESMYNRFRPFSNAALNDCCYAFIKNLPGYFGSVHKLFVGGSANSTFPNVILNGNMPTMDRWMAEQNVDFAATLEISNQINYSGGTYVSGINATKNSPVAFSVGEYTLRNQMMYYCGFVLGALT